MLMSQTLFVKFRGGGFWAFDVLSAVFLKHLIEVAIPHLERPGHAWLSEAVARWRVNAVVSDFGLYLDDAWSADQITTFSALATVACDALSAREELPAEEIESWQMVEDLRCFARGLPVVKTAAVVRLGRAVIQLVNGTLPEAPPGTWWLFATENDPPTIRRRE